MQTLFGCLVICNYNSIFTNMVGIASKFNVHSGMLGLSPDRGAFACRDQCKYEEEEANRRQC